MAREYTRSPSPTGSAYSRRSRGNRHDASQKDDQDRSDNRRERRRDGRDRDPRRLSRSRSPVARDDRHTHVPHSNNIGQRHHRDRDDYRRRDRSLGRRHDDDDHHYRSSRRDKDRDRDRDWSRDRRRSRDRHERHRSRERSRGHRPRRHDSRDREVKHRNDSTESKKRKRDDSRTRPSTRDSATASRETSKPSRHATQSAEDQKAAKLAKLEQWKRKRADEEARKREQEAAGGTKAILNEIDQKAVSPLPIASPQSPATPIPLSAPAPYAGKFDPKAIVQKAQASKNTAKKLGGDVPIGAVGAVSSAILPSTMSTGRPSSPLTNGVKTKALKPGNLSGFGLGGKAGASETRTTGGLHSGLDFNEAEDGTRKFVALPMLPDGSADAANDDAGTQDNEDVDEEGDLDIADGDAEALEAARIAAEKRSQAERGEDTTMTEAAPSAPEAEADVEAMEEDEEVDPLDAFMQDLAPVPKPKKFQNQSKAKVQQTSAFFSDDDGEDVEDLDEDNPDSIMAAAEAKIKRKKKDIPTVNHAKITYEPFRRNFYSEPVDMADWTDDEIANLRMEMENIKVRGLDVPKPVQTWAQCGLGVQSLEVIQKLGYEAPTSIQCQAIPAIMSGRDIIGVAKTGSGKTIAFLLPMFRHIKDQRPLDALDGPVGLVLSPTRELATQIHKDCKPFLKALGLRAVCAYGGAPIKDQIADLKRGAEIVVCTPGRMIDLLAANSGRVTNLRRVTYVVLDEADRMFDMGFEPQVMKILANIRPDKQTVLFSATFPRQMEALARKTLTKPVEIVVGGRSVVAPEITQIVEVRAEEQKFVRLLELLGNLYAAEQNEDDRALIFVDRQESADGLLKALMNRGYPCMSIHGGKDQIDRDSTIQDFKAGVVPILIATSVAARGLDVKQLKLVVNYDAPNHLEDYVHRAGRTGRAGNKGTAVTFLTEEQDRYAVDIGKALKQSGQPIPESVQKLADAFLEKVKAGKEKGLVGGFGGKGLDRLDQQRDAEKARERKTYKTGDEPEEAEKEEEEYGNAKVGDDIFAKAASGVKAFDAPASPAATASTPASSSIPGVPKGIDLDGKIIVHKTERPDPGIGSGSKPKNQMDRVAAAVGAINDKLSKAGVMRSGVPIDNKGPDAGAFHATLEINDFPQKARWGVTNRTNVAKILESTGTSITTKGSFYPPGKEPGPNENPKLYILVEGDTEIMVQDAMRELMRLLKEGTLSAAEAPDRTQGRYSVV